VFNVHLNTVSGQNRLQAPIADGRYYRVARRDNLAPGPWSTVAVYAAGTGPGQDGLLIDLPVNQPGFYRLEVSETEFTP
jgi:hypothetical protein